MARHEPGVVALLAPKVCQLRQDLLQACPWPVLTKNAQRGFEILSCGGRVAAFNSDARGRLPGAGERVEIVGFLGQANRTSDELISAFEIMASERHLGLALEGMCQ